MRTAPNDRINVGAIGIGPRCKHLLEHFMLFDEVQLVAISDCRQERLKAAKDQVDEHYGHKDCVAYPDFRRLLARPDIDAVIVATGDRWHALASILAAKAGKDVYSEKPMTLTIGEGQDVVKTMRRFGTVYQCGHQRRSVESYRFQTEVVQKGLIGKVHTVIAQSWENPVLKPQATQPVPPGLDYDMWQGPTPHHPYVPARFNGWNYFWDTGGGTIIAMGCHYTDIAQWGLGTDHTGPVLFAGQGQFAAGNFAEVPKSAEVTCTYADGTKLVLLSRGAFAERFIRFVGTEGWIQVDDDTNIVAAEPMSLMKLRQMSARSWAHPGNHIRNFLDCIRSRQETICPPLKSHRATVIGHAANISLRLGRSVEWDPVAETFPKDEEARRMMRRSLRAPWRV